MRFTKKPYEKDTRKVHITSLALPCLAFGVGRLLHLPSAEAVSVRPNAHPQK